MDRILRRLRTIRYALGDIAFVLGRAGRNLGHALVRIPVAIGHGFGEFWRSLSVIARRRLVAALGIAVLVLAFFALLVPNLPCSFPGGDSCPPADDAAAMVPADALAYVHADLDPETDEYSEAVAVAEKLPVLGGQVIDRAEALLPAPGAGVDFDRDIRPWFGGEAALVLLGGPGPSERVDLLEIADTDGADSYADELAVGQTTTSDVGKIELTTDARGITTARVNDFLVIGRESGVREVVGTATGAEGTKPLDEDSDATELRDQLPEHRFAEVWLSPDGIRRVIASNRGLLGTLTPLVSPGMSTGAAASLSASGDGLEVAVRSALSSGSEGAAPGFFEAFPGFEPDLAQKLPTDTLAYLGTGSPKATVTALLGQAARQAPGIATGFRSLVRSLVQEADVNVRDQLLGSLGDQAAFAIEPAPGAGGEADVVGTPYLMFLASGVDEDAARRALAALQGPIAAAVGSGGAQAPSFSQRTVAGIDINSLTLSPVIELTYAVFDGLVAIATNPAGVERLIGDQGGLDEDDLYARATDGFPDEVSLIAFLDLGDLVAIGERAGLAEDPLYATFAGDVRRLDGLGLAVSESDDVLATDLRLLVGDAPAKSTGVTSPSND